MARQCRTPHTFSFRTDNQTALAILKAASLGHRPPGVYLRELVARALQDDQSTK
jgi:hypothetical protein